MQNQCKQWDMTNIFNIMFTCFIFNNMFFRDEQDKNLKHCLNPIVAHRASREAYPSRAYMQHTQEIGISDLYHICFSMFYTS